MKIYKMSDEDIKTYRKGKIQLFIIFIVLLLAVTVLGNIFVGPTLGGVGLIGVIIIFGIPSLINTGKDYIQVDGNILSYYMKKKLIARFDLKQVETRTRGSKNGIGLEIVQKGKVVRCFTGNDVGVAMINQLIQDVDAIKKGEAI